MSVDRPKPRTETTFFPNLKERDSLATSDVVTLAQMLRSQPDMSGRFLHELWRNNRDGDILKLHRTHRAISARTFFDMSQSTAMMRCTLNEPANLAGQFIVDITEILTLPSDSIDDRDLSTRAKAEAIAQPVLGDISRMVLAWQASQNEETTN